MRKPPEPRSKTFFTICIASLFVLALPSPGAQRGERGEGADNLHPLKIVPRLKPSPLPLSPRCASGEGINFKAPQKTFETTIAYPPAPVLPPDEIAQKKTAETYVQ